MAITDCSRPNVSAQLVPATTHLADQLDASVRYDDLVQEVVRISGDSKFHTLEALAETIARRLLRRYDSIQRITVSVAKLSPPMPHIVEQARIEVSLDADEVRRVLTQAHHAALTL
jgi:7,8-dihydroneopterin aldolase/epimerase/oxygenase